MKNNNRNQAIGQVVMIIAILFCINILSSFFFARLDLTTENRYSLTAPTRLLLKNLNNEVFIRVYLEGEFPAGFKRLRNSIEEMLDEFKIYAGDQLNYEFIDPSKQGTDKEKNEAYQELIKQGLTPTNLQVQGVDEYKEQIIFPGAIITYKGHSMPVSFLNNQLGVDPHVALNNSVAMLEYKIANVINKLQREDKPKIAFTEGHGELNELQVKDIADALSEFYELHRIDLTKGILIDSIYDAIIIAGPRQNFRPQDIYKLDQYVMHGGKILWVIETIAASMDSMKSMGKAPEQFITMDYPLGLEKILFDYGVRINTDLIQDMQCNYIPIVVGMQNNTPQMKNFTWVYFPVITPEASHPVVKNLDLIMTKFASSIDTIKTSASIHKKILLSSSQYSRSLLSPVEVTTELLRNPPTQSQFNKKHLPIAVLIEGKFHSTFRNQLSDATARMMDTLGAYPRREQSDDNKMIVLSDVDLIRNDTKGDQIVPLGYYSFTQQTFANKDFIINCIEYLVDKNGLIASRAKDVKLRMLDKGRVKKYNTKYRVITLGVPLLFLLLLGAIFNYIRTRKYAK